MERWGNKNLLCSQVVFAGNSAKQFFQNYNRNTFFTFKPHQSPCLFRMTVNREENPALIR